MPFLSVITTRNRGGGKKPAHPQKKANPVDKSNNSYAPKKLAASGLNGNFSRQRMTLQGFEGASGPFLTRMIAGLRLIVTFGQGLQPPGPGCGKVHALQGD